MKSILARDVKRERVELPAPVAYLEAIDFVSVSKYRRGTRVTWRVEFSATQLRRFIRAAIEGNSLLEENEALSNENAMLKRNNDTLMKNLEVDWPSRKEAVELEFQRLQDSEGKASVHACSGGLPSLGRR